MTTGRSIVSACPASVALAGNPSDEFGGAAVAITVPDLTAMAALRESSSGSFVHRPTGVATPDLVAAVASTYADRFGAVPPVELSLSSSIPASVGLADRSALVVAALRSLAAFESHTWDTAELAAVTASVLGDEQPGNAVLAAQAAGRSASSTFDPEAVEPIDLPEDAHVFVAWSSEPDEANNAIRRSLRRRFDGEHPDVVEAVAEWRMQAARARRGLLDEDVKLLADAMHRTLAVRLHVSEVTPVQRRLIEVGRGAGAAINTPGTAGAVVGLARHADHLDRVVTAYEAAGFTTALAT